MRKIPLYKDIRLYTFLGIIAFLLFHHFYGYFGHYGFDDIIGYGFYGKKWADGELFFINEDFFSYRWGFISLTGLSYALFGMNDFSSAIVSLLVILGTVALIFKVLKGEERIVAVIAALIYVLDNWTMYYSDKLMPDTSVALATFAAFAVIYNYRFESDGTKPTRHAIALSLVLIWAYITKQSVLLLFPVFFVLLFIDVIKKRNLKFWIHSALSCIFMGLLYLFVIYLITGDPLARFHAVEAGLDDNLGSGRSFAFCNYAIQPWSVLWYRISFEMIYKFMTTGMIISLMLAVPALVSHKFKDLVFTNSKASFWAFVLLLSLLSSNFMTTSYKAYLPICPDIRHFLFLVPMAAVVAAPVLFAFAQKAAYKKSFQLITGLICVLGFWHHVGNLRWVYAGVFGLVLLRALLSEKVYVCWAFLIGVAIAALAPIVSSIQTARKHSYVEQRTVIYTYFKDKPHQSIVLTNAIQKNFGQYLMEFEADAPTQFYDYAALDSLDLSSGATVYVLLNGAARFMANFDYNNLPQCIKDCNEGKKHASIDVVYQSPKVTLYRLNEPELLREQE